MTASVRGGALIAMLWLALSSSAAAQGKSESAPGQARRTSNPGAAAAAAATVSPATATASTSAPAASANSALYFGSWLDDASMMAPRTLWLGVATAYWKAETARQVDAPIVMGALGISPRAQIGASLPVYHFRDETGLADSGVGTVSVYGKVMLLDPASQRRVGVAVAPLVEVVP